MYINYSLIMFTFWKPSAPIWYGNNYRHMKPQSALHNYNLVKLGKSEQFNFLKLNPPFIIYFGKSPHIGIRREDINSGGGHQCRHQNEDI